MHKINLANIKDWAKNYDGPLFDGILCDPPYELGFMGKSWDSTGIAFDVEMWQNIYKLLKPGAHLLAFSGSRTYHRMAVAIEDAGFEIRDMIEWVYGSGFPKSLNVSKAIEAKEKYGKTGTRTLRQVEQDGNGESYKLTGKNNGILGETKVFDRKVYTPQGSAIEWSGYGTALKPAHEPCVLARKPIKGTVANNCLEYGTGGLNIDGSRIPANWKEERPQSWFNSGKSKSGKPTYDGNLKTLTDSTVGERLNDAGRFPANLIHDGSDEVLEVFPETGKGNGKGVYNYNGTEYNNKDTSMFNGDKPQAPSNFNDSGSASRFFYTAKSSKSERNAGLDGFEPTITNDGRKTDIDNAFQRGITERKNHHPTVKPLALTKYLATLIKPPKGGRLLVPFSGSGSEMIGALQAGWEYVEGVELTEEYIPIAEARIKYWVSKIQEAKDNEQPSLFDV